MGANNKHKNNEYRHQGIAKGPASHVLDALKIQGINKVALLVFERNEAGMRFWENVDFLRLVDI